MFYRGLQYDLFGNLFGSPRPSSTFTGSETAANLNPSNAKTVTLTAQWRANCTENCTELDLGVNESMGYSYSGTVKGVTLKKAGYYKLEVWGAQGGEVIHYSGQYTQKGYGGYSYGVYNAGLSDVIYVVVGSQGQKASSVASDSNMVTLPGGYNGGGQSINGSLNAGSGGGATHIAKVSGVLSSLSSSTNQAKVLIVAGGGGGDGCEFSNTGYSTQGQCTNQQATNGSQQKNINYGGSGGGYIGGTGLTSSYKSYATGGTQSAGGMSNNAYYSGELHRGSFGQGGLGGNNPHYTHNWIGGGGGGGWYGGGGSEPHSPGGGGGSGYIGNSLLLSAKGVTKQMYQYSTGCTANSSAATKTTCTSSTGAHVANAANTGNGYAKITYLGT